jgi:hypothetical protein
MTALAVPPGPHPDARLRPVPWPGMDPWEVTT